MLMNEFFGNDYEFILASKFKSDSTEQRFSQYKKGEIGRDLEGILSCNALILIFEKSV